MAGERQITTVKNIAGSYAASPMQRGLIFHSLFAPHSGVDIEQILCTLREELMPPPFGRRGNENRLSARQMCSRTL